PHYAERTVYLTDGCAEVNRAADLYLNERARQIAPVRMTGNYGSEVLRRVTAFKPVESVSAVFAADFRRYVHEAATTYAEQRRGHPVSFAAFRQAPWYHYGLLALEQTQLSVRSPYLDDEIVRIAYRAPELADHGRDICLRLIADANPALSSIRTDRGLGPRGLFAAATRALLELQFKAEYAFDYGMPQWLAAIDHRLAPLPPARAVIRPP